MNRARKIKTIIIICGDIRVVKRILNKNGFKAETVNLYFLNFTFQVCLSKDFMKVYCIYYI